MKHDGAWVTKFETKDGRCMLTAAKYWGVYWCARIVGTDKKYGLGRQFVNRINCYTYSLSSGVYDICKAPRKNASTQERYFLAVNFKGEARIIDDSEAIEYAHMIQREIDNSKEHADITTVCAEPLPF